MYEAETLTPFHRKGVLQKKKQQLSCGHVMRRETPFKIEHGPGRDVRVDMFASLAGVGKLFSQLEGSLQSNIRMKN